MRRVPGRNGEALDAGIGRARSSTKKALSVSTAAFSTRGAPGAALARAGLLRSASASRSRGSAASGPSSPARTSASRRHPGSPPPASGPGPRRCRHSRRRCGRKRRGPHASRGCCCRGWRSRPGDRRCSPARERGGQQEPGIAAAQAGDGEGDAAQHPGRDQRAPWADAIHQKAHRRLGAGGDDVEQRQREAEFRKLTPIPSRSSRKSGGSARICTWLTKCRTKPGCLSRAELARSPHAMPRPRKADGPLHQQPAPREFRRATIALAIAAASMLGSAPQHDRRTLEQQYWWR